MMYYKAVLFDDFVIAERILDIENPSAVRTLGRQVKNFDDAMWKKNREHIVYHANLLKFGTNPESRKWLLDTEGKEIIEASPSGVSLSSVFVLFHAESNDIDRNWLYNRQNMGHWKDSGQST
jgi:predicted NAD-dependent protein-ADP-ribosyltransferase YbiA (DUF1768 family)